MEPRLDKSEVLARCRAFAAMAFWPPTRNTNPELWLANFNKDEQEHALGLLNAFAYFNRDITDTLLLRSIRLLADDITTGVAGYSAKKHHWIGFLNAAKFTHLRSEENSGDDTKSGILFMRKVRQIIQPFDEQLVKAEVLLQSLVDGDVFPVIVVDDFAGTGETIISGLRRQYQLTDGSTTSFLEQAKNGTSIYFCPVICTEKARTNIEALGIPTLKVSCAHFLSERMSVLHPDSEMVPAYLRKEMPTMVTEASRRSGSDDPFFGYSDLGLAIGFEHATPDATLPIFYWEGPNWNNLVSRR